MSPNVSRSSTPAVPSSASPRLRPDANETALQKHVAFFAKGKDHITLADTFEGLQALGLSAFRSGPTALLINSTLGTTTTGCPSMSVSKTNIHKGIHGSDSGVFDAGGNFVPEKFDAIFTRFGHGDVLDDDGLTRMLEANREPGLFGQTAAKGEWNLLFDVVGKKDAEGKRYVTRDDLRSFYEGRLFYDIAAQ
jgi:peroxygenase